MHCLSMKIEITVLSEASQKEKRQIPYDITPMWNLKYDTNELIYETETHSQTQRADLWGPKGRWDGRGKQWEFGVCRCKLVNTEWISSKVLLYIQGTIFNIL